MNLSDGEKLILMMLCELHEKLKIEGETDTKLIKSAIINGNLWALKWEMQGIFHGYEPSEDVVREVCNILDMWRALERSHQALSIEDKERVKREAEPFGEYVHFTGFDGNNESQYGNVARFLVEDLGRFKEFKGRDMDSHMPLSLQSYRQMLKVYEPLRKAEDLSAIEIIKVLKARMHRRTAGMN